MRKFWLALTILALLSACGGSPRLENHPGVEAQIIRGGSWLNHWHSFGSVLPSSHKVDVYGRTASGSRINGYGNIPTTAVFVADFGVPHDPNRARVTASPSSWVYPVTCAFEAASLARCSGMLRHNTTYKVVAEEWDGQGWVVTASASFTTEYPLYSQ